MAFLLPPYDARSIANVLLDLAEAKKHKLTQLKLMKVIYFAHGWYLARNNEALIEQEFEAWRHGPVIRAVYQCFQHFGSQPICERAAILDLITGQKSPSPVNIPEYDRVFLSLVLTEYEGVDASKLSEMTHEPGSPWYVLWHSQGGPQARLRLRLLNEDIRNHFVEKTRQRLLS